MGSNTYFFLPFLVIEFFSFKSDLKSTDFVSSIDIDANASDFSELYPSLEGDINIIKIAIHSKLPYPVHISVRDFSAIPLKINSIGANCGNFLSFFFIEFELQVRCYLPE